MIKIRAGYKIAYDCPQPTPMIEPHWRLANCAGKPTVLWFPDPLDDAPFARAVCSGCVIREDCLEYSLVHGIRYGIWGGVGERERRQIRRLRRRGYIAEVA